MLDPVEVDPSPKEQSPQTASPAKADTRLAIWFVSLLFTFLLVRAALHQGYFLRPGKLQSLAILETTKLDLQESQPAELAQLPKVGPKTIEKWTNLASEGAAKPILGPKTQQTLAPFLKSSKDIVVPEMIEPLEMKTSQSRLRIRINSATEKELDQLPGIGPVLAQRIMAARKLQPFRTAEDLRRVSGLGNKRIEALRDLIEFD
jgi:competence ComEA-like helix-hairpin-helix protein